MEAVLVLAPALALAFTGCSAAPVPPSLQVRGGGTDVAWAGARGSFRGMEWTAAEPVPLGSDHREWGLWVSGRGSEGLLIPRDGRMVLAYDLEQPEHVSREFSEYVEHALFDTNGDGRYELIANHSVHDDTGLHLAGGTVSVRSGDLYLVDEGRSQPDGWIPLPWSERTPMPEGALAAIGPGATLTPGAPLWTEAPLRVGGEVIAFVRIPGTGASDGAAPWRGALALAVLDERATHVLAWLPLAPHAVETYDYPAGCSTGFPTRARVHTGFWNASGTERAIVAGYYPDERTFAARVFHWDGHALTAHGDPVVLESCGEARAPRELVVRPRGHGEPLVEVIPAGDPNTRSTLTSPRETP